MGEFGEFKRTAWAMHEAGDDEGCLEYVRNNRHLYAMARTLEWVPDLAAKVQRKEEHASATT